MVLTPLATLCAAGKSCREIAAEVGRSASTVSAMAKANGHSFARAGTEKATAARVVDNAAKRAALATRLADAADEMLDRARASGTSTDAKNYMIAAGIAVDKSVVLDRVANPEGQAKGLLEQLVDSLHDTVAA
jgi:hypothetical protein